MLKDMETLGRTGVIQGPLLAIMSNGHASRPRTSQNVFQDANKNFKIQDIYHNIFQLMQQNHTKIVLQD